MKSEKIPVYDICSLSKDHHNKHEFVAERFGEYLKRHSQSLHHAHRHSFYHLVLFTKGSGTHTIDFTGFPVKPFQAYFMIPGQVHSWHFEGETDGYIINFSDSLFRSFLLNPNYLEGFSFFSGRSDESVGRLPNEIRGKVLELFEEIISHAGDGTYTAVDLVRALLIQLFIVINNSWRSDKVKTLPQQKQVLLRNFRRLIDQHFLSIKLPKEYAELLYVTPNHLNALCKDLLGKTAGELIRDRVLLEAKRLLTNADMSIAEIAYRLNFEDNSYFNRFFKKYEGLTPDAFRKKYWIH